MRIQTNNVKKVMLFFAITLFNIFGTLVAFNSKNLDTLIKIKPLPIFVIVIIIWLLLPIKIDVTSSKLRNWFYLFCAMEFICSCLRFEYSFTIAVTMILFSSILLVRSLNYFRLESIYPVFAWGTIVAAIFTIITFGVSPYNSQGVVYAFAGIMGLNLLCIQRKNKITCYLFIVIVTVIVLSLTRSRTSMMAFLGVAIITYFHLFLKKKTIKNLLIGMAVMVLLIILYNYLQNFFYNIFFQKWGNSDITSNRQTIWTNIWLNKSLFGHGINHMYGGDAHNTVMQVLGVGGIISMVSLVILLFMIIKTIARIQNRIVFINFFVGWMVISGFENLDIFTSRMLTASMLFLVHFFFLLITQTKENTM